MLDPAPCTLPSDTTKNDYSSPLQSLPTPALKKSDPCCTTSDNQTVAYLRLEDAQNDMNISNHSSSKLSNQILSEDPQEDKYRLPLQATALAVAESKPPLRLSSLHAKFPNSKYPKNFNLQTLNPTPAQNPENFQRPHSQICISNFLSKKTTILAKKFNEMSSSSSQFSGQIENRCPDSCKNFNPKIQPSFPALENPTSTDNKENALIEHKNTVFKAEAEFHQGDNASINNENSNHKLDGNEDGRLQLGGQQQSGSIIIGQIKPTIKQLEDAAVLKAPQLIPTYDPRNCANVCAASQNSLFGVAQAQTLAAQPISNASQPENSNSGSPKKSGIILVSCSQKPQDIHHSVAENQRGPMTLIELINYKSQSQSSISSPESPGVTSPDTLNLLFLPASAEEMPNSLTSNKKSDFSEYSQKNDEQFWSVVKTPFFSRLDNKTIHAIFSFLHPLELMGFWCLQKRIFPIVTLQLFRKSLLTPAFDLAFWSEITHLKQTRQSNIRQRYDTLASVIPEDEENSEYSRDLDRTFLTEEIEQLEGQIKLNRVLRALAVTDEYFQGLNYIAAAFLYGFSEHQSFWFCRTLLKKVHHLQVSLQEFNKNMSMLESWVAKDLPELSQHIAFMGLQVGYFATRWFLTLYSYDIPLETMLHLWRLVCLSSSKMLLCFTMVLLGRLQPDILSWEEQELNRQLKHNLISKVSSLDQKSLLEETVELYFRRQLDSSHCFQIDMADLQQRVVCNPTTHS